MIQVESWVVLNFFTAFLLILLLRFQSESSKVTSGQKYSAILKLTLLLIVAESVGRVGEVHPDNLLVLAKVGYFIIFLFDPLDVYLALNYIDCWMNDGNKKSRGVFRWAFRIFAFSNIAAVIIDALFGLHLFFYFEDGLYYRGSLFMIRAALVMLYIILVFVYSLVFRNNFLTEYKNHILYLPLFSLFGAIAQVFFTSMDMTYAGISIGCLVIFFEFQSKDKNLDYMTGVLNRRGLDIKMQNMVDNSTSSGKDFSAIMLDIDNFKLINDRLGHSEGDRAIKCVAESLVDIFGQDAYIGRFGGDEFYVLTDIVNPMVINERVGEVRDELEVYKRKYNWPETVGISCGYHIYDHSSHLSARRVRDIIDEKMYSEKQEHHRNDEV
jgi:diguanylate cyclase (GGDEF)-like protein